MTFDDPQHSAHAGPSPAADDTPGPDDAALRAVVSRLARPHRSGGHVVERAALMADGTGFAALLGWIDAHDGVPEGLPPAPAARGASLLGERGPQQPLRFVLPATAFP